MYQPYFGLQEDPFSIAVNPRYLFMSARHRDALAHLLYGVGVGGGFILLTGEVGTGKTTVNRCLLEQLPDNTDIALILNPALNAVELLAAVCDELKIAYEPGEQSLKVLTDKLHQFLLSNHAQGRNTVLLIDEAQHLQFDVLEQIRLLTNLETNTKKLLQIILVGQPELRSLLNKPELRQLAQRITARYQLKPLNLQETEAYIRHRLQVAGLPANQTLFPRAVIKQIFRASRGIPRIINVLCDRALLGAYGQNKSAVDKCILKQAITEVMGEEEDLQLLPQQNYWPVLTAAGAVVVAMAAWWFWPTTAFEQQIKLPIAAETPPLSAPQPIAQPTTATGVSKWVSTEAQALAELAAVYDLLPTAVQQACDSGVAGSLRCEQLQVESWQAFRDYNRPAVLTLITPAKLLAHAVLVGITESQAFLVQQGELSSVGLAELGSLWTGEFTLLWQADPAYQGPFSHGYRGEIVKWLASRFADIDEQSQALAGNDFNEPLSQRVKIFQQNHQLQADGVVGLKTLLKLNEQLGLERGLRSMTQTYLQQSTAGTVSADAMKEEG